MHYEPPAWPLYLLAKPVHRMGRWVGLQNDGCAEYRGPARSRLPICDAGNNRTTYRRAWRPVPQVSVLSCRECLIGQDQDPLGRIPSCIPRQDPSRLTGGATRSIKLQTRSASSGRGGKEEVKRRAAGTPHCNSGRTIRRAGCSETGTTSPHRILPCPRLCRIGRICGTRLQDDRFPYLRRDHEARYVVAGRRDNCHQFGPTV